MALALALTRTMLCLPYRADTAEDFGRAVRVAIRAASLSRHNGFVSPTTMSCPTSWHVGVIHYPVPMDVAVKFNASTVTKEVQRKDLPGHMMENMDQHLYMIKQKMEAEIASLKCIQSTIQHLPQTVPELTIYYTKEKESTSWFSPPFYIHNGEYRMCLRVDIAGYDEGAGSDVSA
eukprot:Em0003g1176a